VKRPSELVGDDIPGLIKNKQYATLENLIQSDAPSMFESSGEESRMLDFLISKLHDTNGQLLETLYSRSTIEPRIELTDLNYNYLIQSAVNFRNYDFLT